MWYGIVSIILLAIYVGFLKHKIDEGDTNYVDSWGDLEPQYYAIAALIFLLWPLMLIYFPTYYLSKKLFKTLNKNKN